MANEMCFLPGRENPSAGVKRPCAPCRLQAGERTPTGFFSEPELSVKNRTDGALTFEKYTTKR